MQNVYWRRHYWQKNSVTLEVCHSNRSFDFFFITTWPLIRLMLLHYRWLLNLCFFFYIGFCLAAGENTASPCTRWPALLLWMPAVAVHIATLPPWAHCSNRSIQKSISLAPHLAPVLLTSPLLHLFHKIKAKRKKTKKTHSAHVNLVFEKWSDLHTPSKPPR